MSKTLIVSLTKLASEYKMDRLKTMISANTSITEGLGEEVDTPSMDPAEVQEPAVPEKNATKSTTNTTTDENGGQKEADLSAPTTKEKIEKPEQKVITIDSLYYSHLILPQQIVYTESSELGEEDKDEHLHKKKRAAEKKNILQLDAESDPVTTR